MENWKSVVGYEGFYEVSDLGRVRSLDQPNRMCFQKGRILKTGAQGSGHLYVKLYCCGIGINRKVAHLVLEAFVGPRPKGMEACHYPNSRSNKLDNLRWDTFRSNMRDHAKHPSRLTRQKEA